MFEEAARASRLARRPWGRAGACLLVALVIVASDGIHAARAAPPVTAEVTILTLDGAKVALEAAERWARAQGVKASIAVVDTSGTPLALIRMDGAMSVSVENALAKARTAAQLGRPSGSLQEQVNKGRASLLAVEGIRPLQGGMPIIVRNIVVGGIGASGSSAQQDEMISRQGAEALAVAASR